MLKIMNLQKEYHKKKERVRAVDSVSFELEKGELVGLLGPNGAGKTTIVKMICGLVRPDQGHIEIGGVNPWLQRKKALIKVSAVLEGNRNIFWPMTVKENMEYFAALRGIEPRNIQERINKLLLSLDLTDKINVTARSLSRGMQQKLALAVALVSDAPLLILDEPTLGLDVESSLEIRRLLQTIVEEEGKTILLTTHDMHLVNAVCPRVIIINRGRIVTDDLVENMLSLFEARVYRLNLLGRLTEAQATSLSLLETGKITAGSNGNTIIDISLETPEKLYHVMDILRENEAIIDSIERQQIDFEEVFLQIVGRKEDEIVQPDFI